jgi:hypothetical protein
MSSRVGRAIASAIIGALALGGCSAGDVELNGAVFDYLGVSSKTQASKAQPRLGPRAGLVVPPNTEKLPEPGSGVETASVPSADQWPTDPDEARKNQANELERKHAAFCQDALWRARAAGQTDPVRGPNGLCTPSILTTVGVTAPVARAKEGTPDPTSQLPNTFKRN